MLLAEVFAIVGFLLLAIGCAMLLPMGVSLFYGEAAWSAFLIGAVVTWLWGGIMFFVFRNQEQKNLRHREGLAVVGISWTLAVVMCSLPLHFSGEFVSYTDALFEASSGLTATGSTVMADVEKASHGVLLWRSLMHWMGGMGFIILSLAVFPFIGLGGMQLYKAEIPSPTSDRFRPRIKDTASMLWRIYLALTLLAWLLFSIGGMDVFDALCHAMSNMSSGGFSTKNASLAYYNSPLIEWISIFFMIAAGLNFSLYFWLLRGRPVWRDEELRFYLGIIALCALGAFIFLLIYSHTPWNEALRRSVFHITALVTTTGFTTADYGSWPTGSILFLIAAMFVGGCAGSTSGGPKVLRWLIWLKSIMSGLKQTVHPRSINTIRISNKAVDRSVIESVNSYLGLYLICFFVVTMAMAAMGLGLETSFSAALASLGNIGPGLGEVGPAATYAGLPDSAKWLLSAAMIIGRLEMFPILVMFMPGFWRS